MAALRGAVTFAKPWPPPPRPLPLSGCGPAGPAPAAQLGAAIGCGCHQSPVSAAPPPPPPPPEAAAAAPARPPSLSAAPNAERRCAVTCSGQLIYMHTAEPPCRGCNSPGSLPPPPTRFHPPARVKGLLRAFRPRKSPVAIFSTSPTQRAAEPHYGQLLEKDGVKRPSLDLCKPCGDTMPPPHCSK